jgi:hypothetical protein
MRRYRSQSKRHNPSVRNVTPADVEKRVKSIRSRIRKAIQATEVEGTVDALPKWVALKNAVYDLERDAYASGLPSDFGYLFSEVSQGQLEGERVRHAYMDLQLKAAYEEKRLADIERRRHEGWRGNPSRSSAQAWYEKSPRRRR